MFDRLVNFSSIFLFLTNILRVKALIAKLVVPQRDSFLFRSFLKLSSSSFWTNFQLTDLLGIVDEKTKGCKTIQKPILTSLRIRDIYQLNQRRKFL